VRFAKKLKVFQILLKKLKINLVYPNDSAVEENATAPEINKKSIRAISVSYVNEEGVVRNFTSLAEAARVTSLAVDKIKALAETKGSGWSFN
jgi:hypothetical protein